VAVMSADDVMLLWVVWTGAIAYVGLVVLPDERRRAD